MKWIWGLDSEQILALCEIRSKLIEEGWTAVDELRNELIKEMEQVRRARAGKRAEEPRTRSRRQRPIGVCGMKIARSAHWIRVALPLIVSASGSIREALADQGTEACEYLTVVVDPSIADEAAPGHEIAEPMRRKFLEMAAEEFSALGLILVRDRKDAYWILTASRLVGPRSVGVFIELTGSIELQHHLYIAELDRDGFPYRGEAGGNHYVGVLPNSAPEHYRSEVARAARLLWGRTILYSISIMLAATSPR